MLKSSDCFVVATLCATRVAQQEIEISVIWKMLISISCWATRVAQRVATTKQSLLLSMRSDCFVVATLCATRVAQQEIEISVIWKMLERLRENLSRPLEALTPNIRHTKAQKVDKLTLRLFECAFVKRNRLLG